MFDSNGRLWIYDLKNGTGVEIGFTGRLRAMTPSFRQMANSFRLCAITGSRSSGSRTQAHPSR